MTANGKHKILGAPVKRLEDPAMIQGTAPFTADMTMDGMLHMAILRSTHAHAIIKSVNVSAAVKMPGVVKIITGADLVGKMMPMPCVWIPGSGESHFPSHPMGLPGAGDVLPADKVRFVGEPIAAIVAETVYQAQDALSAIVVDYHDLPVVTDAEEALKDGAPQLHDEVANNLNAYVEYGDREAAERGIQEAEVTISGDTYIPRTINSPIEPRAALGVYDPSSQDFTLYATSQSPHNHRLLLAFAILGVPFNKIRLVSPNIGGSFGTKGYIYPDMPLVLYLARETGRPIKWVDDREGLMTGTVQGRDQKMYAKLGGTKNGKITALTCTSYANLGAYPSTIGPGVATAMVGRNVTGVYDIEHPFCEVYAAFTNKVALGAQRGSGRAEATFMLERLIDQYANKIGMDPAEVRRKNMVRSEQMPFDNRMGWEYDSGDYQAALDQALNMIDYDGFQARRAAAVERGKRRGIGIGSFVAVSGVGPSSKMAKEGMLGGTWESANVRVHPTGEVELSIGSTPHGQSHMTTFAQIVAEEIGADVAQIRVLHSDTKQVPFGQGSYGSRSFSVGGAAVQIAAREIREKCIKYAAHKFRVLEEDIVFENGAASVRNDPSQSMTLQEISLSLYYSWDIPPGMEPSLEKTTFLDPPGFNFPYGCNVAEVEIDERTGEVDIIRYVAVNDVGTIGNKMVLEGQLQGAIAFGIGEAMLEESFYDEDGQPHTTSFTDYPIPRATHLPEFELEYIVTPTPHTDLGAKGAGEVGTVGAPAALGNAVVNALSDLGVRHIDMPLTPERVWQAINQAQRA